MKKKSLRRSSDPASERFSLVASLRRKERTPKAIRDAKTKQWLEENREAIAAYNARIERDGPWNRDLVSF